MVQSIIQTTQGWIVNYRQAEFIQEKPLPGRLQGEERILFLVCHLDYFPFWSSQRQTIHAGTRGSTRDFSLLSWPKKIAKFWTHEYTILFFFGIHEIKHIRTCLSQSVLQVIMTSTTVWTNVPNSIPIQTPYRDQYPEAIVCKEETNLTDKWGVHYSIPGSNLIGSGKGSKIEENISRVWCRVFFCGQLSWFQNVTVMLCLDLGFVEENMTIGKEK